MKKLYQLAVFSIFVLLNSNLVIFSQKPITQDERMGWWREARFGMFIHWGPVSLTGQEIGWSRGDKVPIEEYDQLYKRFNPADFNANKWVNIAKEAGMKYIILTTKHHDGFCLWDTRQSEYNIMNSPFNRDVVKELSEACKKQGIRFGAYYSTCDWWHPDFPLTSPGGKVRKPIYNLDAYTQYLKRQVAELLINYSPLAVLWFDVPQEFDEVRGQGIVDFARTIQPDIIINNRTGAKGDFETPEQYIPDTGLPGVDWESCMTINNQWAFSFNDNNWKSATVLVHNLIDIASKGGNYLLNIGPDSKGIIPQQSIQVLKEMGTWLKVNGEAIYGTNASPFRNITGGRVTQKKIGNTTQLFFHVFDYPRNGKIVFSGLVNDIIKAYPLQNKKVSLRVERKDAECIVDISSVKPEDYATVIVLEIQGKPVVYDIPEIIAENQIFIEKQTFEIKTNVPNGVIYFTTNGEIPTEKSKLAIGEIIIYSKKDIRVKARLFLDGKPVSGIAETIFKRENPLSASSAGISMVKYKYYEGKWKNLPDFTKLTPVKSRLIANFNLNDKNAQYHYAFLFEAYLNVPETDVYKIFLTSDDGSKIIIDDQKIIDNDGIHGMIEKSMSVALFKGLHKIQVQYFQQTGGSGLKIEWKPTGKTRVIIDEKLLK